MTNFEFIKDIKVGNSKPFENISKRDMGLMFEFVSDCDTCILFENCRTHYGFGCNTTFEEWLSEEVDNK